MRYAHVVPGIFHSRPNRFIAHIEIDGKEEICHVKNTGRCRELLQPHCHVYCQKSINPARKTQYDLIAVQKGSRLINMDSQAPNAAAWEWLSAGGLGEISQLRREVTVEDSRFDFAFTKDGQECFLEVKGVTLEHDGICAFPDAPTLRGTRHVNGLTRLSQTGCQCYVLFVIQMEDVKYLHPNDETDPAFGAAVRQAAAEGVNVLAVNCRVTEDTMQILDFVNVKI